MTKKKKTKAKAAAPQKKTAAPKVEKKKAFSYVAFYVKDILLCVFLVAGLAYFVKGNFYTQKEVKKYERQVRSYLNSNATQAEKDKVSKEKKTNINRIRVKWGYFFAYNNLLVQNYKRIKQNPEMEYKNKIYSKSGAWGFLLNHIAENTPEDAQIYIPLSEKELRDSKYSFAYGNQNPTIPQNAKYKKYVNWYLYPRRVVFNTEIDKDRKDASTHVFIFDKKGAENAQPEPGKQLQNYAIYPFKKS